MRSHMTLVDHEDSRLVMVMIYTKREDTVPFTICYELGGIQFDVMTTDVMLAMRLTQTYPHDRHTPFYVDDKRMEGNDGYQASLRALSDLRIEASGEPA